MFGYCEDAHEDIPKRVNRSKQKRRNRRECDRKYRNHLKYFAKNISGYSAPVMYTDEVWVREQGYIENPKPYYKRLYRSRGRGMSYYHKKMSNRKVRRYKGEMPSGLVP